MQQQNQSQSTPLRSSTRRPQHRTLSTVIRAICFAYVIVDVLSRKAPLLIAQLNNWVDTGNTWFKGLAPWTKKVVTFFEGVDSFVCEWLPHLGLAILVAILWALLKRIIKRYTA